jgi:flagellin-like protein
MRRNTSVGLSPLVAVVLLIAITVAAAVVVSGVFFNLASIAGRRPSAVIDQVKLVATPAGAGTWTIVVKNTGDVPITTI